MKTLERKALFRACIIVIDEIKHGNFTRVILKPYTFNWQSWPNIPRNPYHPELYDTPGTNTSSLIYKDKIIGLRHCRDNDSISVDLGHPMAKYWLSFLEPVWKEQNDKIRCKTCRDTGWDGIGYRLVCCDCGASKKD